MGHVDSFVDSCNDDTVGNVLFVAPLCPISLTLWVLNSSARLANTRVGSPDPRSLPAPRTVLPSFPCNAAPCTTVQINIACTINFDKNQEPRTNHGTAPQRLPATTNLPTDRRLDLLLTHAFSTTEPTNLPTVPTYQLYQPTNLPLTIPPCPQPTSQSASRVAKVDIHRAVGDVRENTDDNM